jgi:hypothetical protein
MKLSFVYILGTLAVMGCSTGSQLSITPYEEDLSVHRKDALEPENEIDYEELLEAGDTEASDIGKYEFESDISADLNSLLDSLHYYNKLRGYVEGYTVQIYNGRSREEAFEMKKRLYEVLEIEAEVSYVQPNFKVKVGQYLDQFEALKVQKQIEEDFNNVLVIPERISLK